jgi:lysophospholipase L1-like esterase
MPSGLICFQPVQSANMPTNFMVGGGGTALSIKVCRDVLNGAIQTTLNGTQIGSLSLASSALSSPANVNYQISLTDNTSGDTEILGVASISGSSWSLDQWTPTGVTTLGAIGPSFISGPLTASGDITAPRFHGLADLASKSQSWQTLPQGCPAGYSPSTTDVYGNFLQCNANSYQATGTTPGMVAQNPAGSQMITLASGAHQRIGTAAGYVDVDSNGNVSTPAGVTASTVATTTQLPTDWWQVSAWGDSLTAGNEDGTGTSYPGVLQTLLNLPVFNGGVGGNTSPQISARMLAATSRFGNTDVFWAGRNNYGSQATVLSDIASMVAALTPPKRFLVMSVINGAYPGEGLGGSGYSKIIALNNALASAYPNNYFDVRSFLVGQYDPTNPSDVIDHNNDVPPSSLRAVDFSTTVQANIGASDATIQLGKSPSNGTILTIDSEEMLVASGSGSSSPYTVAVTRGYASTTAASHSNGTSVSGIDPLHLNAAGYTLVAQQVNAWLRAHIFTTLLSASAAADLVAGAASAPVWLDSFVQFSASSGTVTLDLSAHDAFYVYAQGSITLSLANATVGRHFSLEVCNNSSGGNTISFSSSAFRYSSFVMPSAAWTCAAQSFVVLNLNGSNLAYPVGPQINSDGTTATQSVSQTAYGTNGTKIFIAGDATQLQVNTNWLPDSFNTRDVGRQILAWRSLHLGTAINFWDSTGTYDMQVSAPAHSANFSQTLMGASGQIPVTNNGTPASNASCAGGQQWYDGSYFYVCTATGTVKKAALNYTGSPLSPTTKVWGSFLGNSSLNGGSQYVAQMVLGEASTITRFLVTVAGGATCTTQPVFEIYDATTSTQLATMTINNGQAINDSGALSISVGSSDVLRIRVSTEGSCTTFPTNINIAVEYAN